MTTSLLDEARGLPAMPPMMRLHYQEATVRELQLAKRLSIAVRALRESAGDNYRDVDVLAIADLLEVSK